MNTAHPEITAEHLHIGMLVFPDVDQLDFTGPFEVLSRVPGADVHVVWKSLQPVADVRGLVLTPNVALGSCPRLDVVVVPGGRGQQRLMEDREILEFLRGQARHARYVMSVCTGALVLGAAGLLTGYRATTHWMSMELLAPLGAVPVAERVVVDRDRVTCAGVTSGIDGALTLAALLRGDTVAQAIQLFMEYDPRPPHHAGSPRHAPPEVLAAVTSQADALRAERRATVERIARARSP